MAITHNHNAVAGEIVRKEYWNDDHVVDPSDLGLVPIGSIIPWLKSYANTPALTENFVECNGQVLSDAESPYDGQTIPDLNGSNYFLRGNSTSGGTGGASTNNLAHTHDLATFSALAYPADLSRVVYKTAGNIIAVTTTSGSQSSKDWLYSYTDTAGSAAQENKPPYYNVVWIMRIK